HHPEDFDDLRDPVERSKSILCRCEQLEPDGSSGCVPVLNGEICADLSFLVFCRWSCPADVQQIARDLIPDVVRCRLDRLRQFDPEFGESRVDAHSGSVSMAPASRYLDAPARMCSRSDCSGSCPVARMRVRSNEERARWRHNLDAGNW